MSKLNICIDVDLTFVDSGTPWIYWLQDIYQCNPDYANTPKSPCGKAHYNLSKYFPKPGPYQIDPYDFWEDPHLYDKLVPIAGAVDAVKAWAEAGHNILFVSHCKNGHFSSKVRMLKRECPFLDLDGNNNHGFYATKNKSGVKSDIFIDDRNNFLNQLDKQVVKIRFDTPYTQDEELKVSLDYESNYWPDIQNFVLDNF